MRKAVGLKILAGFVLVMAVAVPGHSYSPHEDPAYHVGANCTPCHERFQVNNTDVRLMFPCAKKPCHDSGTRWGNGTRFAIHMNKSLCFGCHVSVNGEYDVHMIHRSQVNCRVCHQSFRGWNSSIATVPAPRPEDIRRVEGLKVAIPRDRECGYCHPSAREPKRLHDIHKPVLDKACDSCHSDRHTGKVCITCHESFFLNATSIQPSNCRDNGCHSRSPAERQQLHLKKEMCINCHPALEGEYNIHLIHRAQVNCRVCHQSFRGWNSSIATIPVPSEDEIKTITGAEVLGVEGKEVAEYVGITIAVPKESECSYCHQSAYHPSSIHDVHRPVLEKACVSCHNRTRSHSGNICVTCHDVLGVNSTAVEESNCQENGCHTSTRAERQRIHIEKSICKNCHNSTGGELDVHRIHRAQVNCRVCHQSFLGWNSSIATIPKPGPGEIVMLEGLRFAVPKERECGYCHPTARSPLRLHDVHSPVKERACRDCHRNYSFEEGAPAAEPASRWGRWANLSLLRIGREEVDISCDKCHEDLFHSFFNDNKTAWIAELHMWAGSADNFIGPSGEIKYQKNFTNNMESNSCLLCHVVEGVDVYKNIHTNITFRPCTHADCHGSEDVRGTEVFVDAGYLGMNLASHQDAHSRGFTRSQYKGWRMCLGCHEIHPGRQGIFSRLRSLFGLGG